MEGIYRNSNYTADRLAKQFEHYECNGQLNLQDCFDLETGKLLTQEQKDHDEEMGR